MKDARNNTAGFLVYKARSHCCWARFYLECDAVFEDGNLAVAVLLVAGFFARGDGKDLVDEFGNEFLHGAAFDELSGGEIDPVGLVLGEYGIGGDLHGGHESAEGRAAAGGEEYDVAAAGGEGRGGYEVVAGGGEQVQTVGREAVAILHDTADGSLTALLGASEGFVLEGGDAAGLVARRGILADGFAVGEEIVLEIVDHRDGLLEQLGGLATVHEDGFGTEHLGNLGEHAGATLSHEPVREFTDKWIGGDATETVGATTLQTDAELGDGNILALVLCGLGIEFAENLHASLNLVAFNALSDEQLNTRLVVVAKHGHEVLWLVVLAAEAEHEHATGIGVETDVAQYLAGVFVVLGELRAAVVVMPGPDGVDVASTGFLHQAVGKVFSNAVDAADGGHNPYLVTHADVTILANITLKGSVFVFDCKWFVDRLIRVFERSAEVGLEIVLIDPVTGLHVLTGMTDGVAVLDNVFAFFDVGDEYFVTCRSVLIQRDLLAVDGDDVALLFR